MQTNIEGTDLYLDVCEKAIESFTMRCTNKKDEPIEITVASKTEELTKGNLGVFGHVLLDLHEQFEAPILYDEFTQYRVFPSVEEVVEYFCKYGKVH